MRLDRIKVICLLTKRDLMKKDLAEKTGLNRNTISAICSGKRCSEITARRIAEALGVKVEELIEN